MIPEQREGNLNGKTSIGKVDPVAYPGFPEGGTSLVRGPTLDMPLFVSQTVRGRTPAVPLVVPASELKFSVCLYFSGLIPTSHRGKLWLS